MKEKSTDQVLVAQGTGFIPCPAHTEQIINGKINLIDLIQGRACDTPFPIDDWDVSNGPEHIKYLSAKYEHVMFPKRNPELNHK